ncbi:MAG: GNAT family N-acetyltransferase [Bdellovibrionota bacterium]
MKVDVRAIVYGSKDYDAEVKLRHEILRQPLGLKFSPDDLAAEAGYLHFGAFADPDMVGTMQLVKLDEQVLKMRQVAVSALVQGQGVGRLLVDFAEHFAKSYGFQTIVLHARDTAIPFYDKLGYETISEIFEEVGIPHRKMQKLI